MFILFAREFCDLDTAITFFLRLARRRHHDQKREIKSTNQFMIDYTLFHKKETTTLAYLDSIFDKQPQRMKFKLSRLQWVLLVVSCAVAHVMTGAASAFNPSPAFVPSMELPRQTKIKTCLGSAVLSKEPIISGEHKLANNVGLLLEADMKQIKLPMFAVGKECVIIPLKIKGKGPFSFMIDTGLTIEMISPRLKDMLDIEENKEPATGEGLAAGGATGKVKLANLTEASLCGKEEELDLPTLQAVITNFAQEKLDQRHPVSGMIGMEMLERFDVDLDFPAGVIRLWAPGEAEKEARRQRMVEIPIAVINNSLLLGTRLTGRAANSRESKSEQKQPFLGIIDSGSTFSAVNWKAAELLGLPHKNSLQYLQPPGIMAVGIDNKPLYIPTKKVEFTFCGGAISNDKGEVVGFATPPPEWRPWKAVLAGIGDLPAFELMLGTEKTPFQGPAALIGMDVLSQRRIILESCSRDESGRRTGRMFVSSD